MTVLGAAGLLLVGYLLGRWQDTPAAPVVPTPASAGGSAAPVVTSAAPDPEPSAGAGATPIEYAVLQAESATELSGVERERTDDEGGGENIGYVNRDDHLRFDNFEFGAVAANRVAIRLSSGSDITGRVQIRLDSRDAAPVGELSVSNTGGWQTWRTDTAALQPVTGVHTVFVTFSSDDGGEFVNINWLRFEH